MAAAEIVSEIASFERRGAGTDAERRAARGLADHLSGAGRDVRLEPFWCRPNWALAHAWHVLLALAGSLLCVHSPRVGGALIVVALVSVIADELTGISLGRRLTPERASQNVVATAPPASAPVRLILVANYDAGRVGLIWREGPRAAAAQMHTMARGVPPGWLGWLVIAFVWLLAIALIRLAGTGGTSVGIAQLLPTAALVVALVLLLDAAASEPGPAAGDNGSGVAAAIALARALDAAPPRRLQVDLVLEGAGDVHHVGMRTYVRMRRKDLKPANAVFLALAPSGGGAPRWWLSDGSLLPLRYFPRLRALAKDQTPLGGKGHRGRGATCAFPARLRGLPAITIGSLDDRGLAPRSHQPEDLPRAVDENALNETVQAGLVLIDAVDGYVARTRANRAPAGT